LLLTPQRRDLMHGYDEDLTEHILCYRLEEVVAEKMRTLLQTQQKLAERGWNRPRARDYYDLWRILTEFGDTLEREQLPGMLERKCAHRGVSFSCLDDFFTEQLAAEARKNWEKNLGTFVKDLPPCEEVLAGLRTLIPDIKTLPQKTMK
jgi:predicted nucleotidyltransferase component of viral defense system